MTEGLPGWSFPKQSDSSISMKHVLSTFIRLPVFYLRIYMPINTENTVIKSKAYGNGNLNKADTKTLHVH